MAPYVYSVLDHAKRAIRLIRLSRSFSIVNPIHIELIQTTIGDVPFEALSYTWGSMEKPYSVKIDGIGEIAVTYNAYVALQHLRLPFEDRLLWVDAICINQEDVEERGHQVGQMTLIYESAERVLIWLGNSHPMIDDFFITLEAVRHRLLDGTSRNDGDPVTKTVLQACLKPQHIMVFQALLKSLWFTRIWVLQEVASARAAMVLCGSNAVSTRLFTLIPAAFDIRVPKNCQAVLDIMPGPSRKQSWWAERRDLRKLLSMFSASEASDERDMVYALMGICSDHALASASIPLDYSKTLGQVQHGVAVYIIRQVLDLSPDELPPKLRSSLLTWSTHASELDHEAFPGLEQCVYTPQLESRIFYWILEEAALDMSRQIPAADNALAYLACTNHKQDSLLVRLFHPRNRFRFDIMAYICFLAESNVPAYMDLFQKLLLSQAVDFGTTNKTGDTVLHRAAAGWPLMLCEALLRREDVDPNKQNVFGVTPFLIAFLQDRQALMKVFLDSRAIDLGRKAEMMYGSHVLGDFNSIFQLATPQSIAGVSLQDPFFWDPPPVQVHRFCDRTVGVRRRLLDNFCAGHIIRSEDWSGSSRLAIACECLQESTPSLPSPPKAYLVWSDELDESLLDIAVARGGSAGVKAILDLANTYGHVFDVDKSLRRAVLGERPELAKLLLSYSGQSHEASRGAQLRSDRTILAQAHTSQRINRWDREIDHQETCVFTHITGSSMLSELFATSRDWKSRRSVGSIELRRYGLVYHEEEVTGAADAIQPRWWMMPAGYDRSLERTVEVVGNV